MAAEDAYIAFLGDALPADAEVVCYQARELVSAPYEVNVDFASRDSAFDVGRCLGEPLLLKLVDGSARERFFHGVVDQAHFVDVSGDALLFRVRLRPALAALAHRSNCRIFQDKTIIQVIQTIFEEAGCGASVKWLQRQPYNPRELVVQYRESDLNFVSRLLEDNGLFYWFGHSADGHVMAISDDSAAFAALDETPLTQFAFAQSAGAGAEPLDFFERRRRLRTSRVEMRDYDFEKPDVKPSAQQPGQDAWPARHFVYPGGFRNSADGNQRASARMRSLRAGADTIDGKSHAIGLRVGVPFSVVGARQPDLNGSFIVTELVTEGRQLRQVSDRHLCNNEFKGIVKDAPYGPPRRAHRPRIRGLQTAIVTGSSEQEQAIHCDEYGRIKVRFYWDRVGQQDHTSSCWLRVSQLPLGGSMILPRVGWEVSVAFLDGDPDRPFVVDRVYNAEKVPPYGLPAASASGALKSYSSPGGAGFNEIKMSDSGGAQAMSIHAQKDLNITIGHDKNESVGVNESVHVSVNGSASVGGNESIEVGGDQSINVGAQRTQNIGADQTVAVGGNDVSNATANFLEKIGGDRSYSVGGNQTTICNGIRWEVSGDRSDSVGAAEVRGAIGDIEENVAGSCTQTVGAVMAHLVKGDHGENVAGSKTLTNAVGQLHLTKGGISQSCDGAVSVMVGGLHYQKLDGDLVIKAPMVSLLGGIGIFKAGGSELKLGGGPIVAKGTKIAIKGAMIVKMGSSLKMG